MLCLDFKFCFTIFISRVSSQHPKSLAMFNQTFFFWPCEFSTCKCEDNPSWPNSSPVKQFIYHWKMCHNGILWSLNYIFWSYEGLSQKGPIKCKHCQSGHGNIFPCPVFCTFIHTHTKNRTWSHKVLRLKSTPVILASHSVKYTHVSVFRFANDATSKSRRCLNMTLGAPVMPDSSRLGTVQSCPPLKVDMPQVGALRRSCLIPHSSNHRARVGGE